jgi:hypothetical protein
MRRLVAKGLVATILAAGAAPSMALAQAKDADPAAPVSTSKEPPPLAVEYPDPAAKDTGRKWIAGCEDPYAIRLGCVLRIRASGAMVKDLQDVGSKKVRLVLDDVAVPDLAVDFEDPAKDETGMIVKIALKRDSESNDSRKAWDQVLKRQNRSLMRVRVGLELDGKRTVRAQPDMVPFYVASGSLIWTVLAACLAVFFGAFYLLVRNDAVLRDVKGGNYSLGKTQMAFWGLIVALSFLGLWVITGEMERIPSQVLVLIGISATTGLGAVLISASNRAATVKEREETLSTLEREKAAQLLIAGSPEAEQKKALLREIALLRDPGSLARLVDERSHLMSDAAAALQNPASAESQRLKQVESEIKVLYDLGVKPPAKPDFLLDILNDGNGVSFHRLQSAIWTLILGLVFIRSVSQTMTMPEFSDTLLTLMAISAGTYLGFKFPEKTAS